MSVLVFGSINMDLVARTPRLPAAGETLTGHSFSTLPGGKGANQAVAAARLGAPVEMIGRVGADEFGQALVTSLSQAGVGVESVVADPDTSSGVALIEVDDQGENRIIIIPGANGEIDDTDLKRLGDRLPQAHVLLLQLEVPTPAVVAAARAAHQAGVSVILDPAPVRADLPDDVFPAVHILTPNQVEASQLVGSPIETMEEAKQAAIALQQRGADTVIVKLGGQGSVCVTPDDTIYTPAFPVQTVDTVAAGDAFNGGLAAALAMGRSLRDSLTWATATAAIAVTRQGAQPAMPTQVELHRFFTAHELTLHLSSPY